MQDLKLGHYLKIPPRASFLVQLISSILCVTCQIAVKEWMFDTLPDMCERDQPDRLTCPRNRVFYTASAVWCVTQWEGAKTNTDAQPLRLFPQGPCRPCSVIWPQGCLQIFHVGCAHRLCCAYPALVVATPVPGHSTEIYQLACHAQRPHTRPTRKRDQLRKLDHRWVYLPYVFIFYLFMQQKEKKSFHSLFYLFCWV